MNKTLGTLLPFNSVWSKKFPGDFFESGKLFIDCLSKTGQNVWQILPISPTSWKVWGKQFSSPYSSYGVGFNTMFLKDGEQVVVSEELRENFLKHNSSWVWDFALFCVISEREGTDDWLAWPALERDRDEETLEGIRQEFATEINLCVLKQIYLWGKFRELKEYANKRNVQIWGDIPFYLPLRSPLMWKEREAFLLTNSFLEFVAGSPGGKHFTKRQVWGFPLYYFESKAGTKQALKIWKMRVGYLAELFNYCRLDAAVRFFQYEKLSLLDPSQDTRLWGPGEEFFAQVVRHARRLGMEIYIEDISSLDMNPLHKACEALGVPGISVATMILAPQEVVVDPIDFDLTFPKNHIYFTSSHDTAPLVGYIDFLTDVQREVVAGIFGIPVGASEKMAEGIRDKLREQTNVLIVAIGDWLLSPVRINIPGVTDIKNWNYLMEVPVEELSAKIKI